MSELEKIRTHSSVSIFTAKPIIKKLQKYGVLKHVSTVRKTIFYLKDVLLIF